MLTGLLICYYAIGLAVHLGRGASNGGSLQGEELAWAIIFGAWVWPLALFQKRKR